MGTISGIRSPKVAPDAHANLLNCSECDDGQVGQARQYLKLHLLIAWPDTVIAVQIIEGKAYPYWETHLYLHEAAFARAYDHFFGPQVRIQFQVDGLCS